ncbi:MAG TPA: PilZ domain-containing protein [Anaerolineales bacterium]|jgi:hypothetical protein|nr:PilZ domain-containing protein [Anaerolineales bacterium]
MQDDRRKTKRKYLLYYGRVFDERAQKLLGYLVDITEKGLMVLSEEQFPIGQTQKIKVEVTSDIGEGPFLIAEVKSVWCEPDVDPSRFDTGFEIVSIKPEDKKIIDAIIKTYGFRDN